VEIKGLSILKQIRGILLSGIVIVTVLFLSGKFLFPKITQMSELHRKLKKNEAEVLDLEKKAAFLEKQQAGTLLADFEKVVQVLPNEKDVAALLVSLEHLRKNSDLRFEGFALKPGLLATAGVELKTGELKEIKFSISVSSPYDSLIKFLEIVENAAPLTSVEEAKIDFNSEEEEIKASLVLKTYYLPLKEKQLTPEMPLSELSSSAKEILKKILGFEVFTYEISLSEEEIGKGNPFLPLDLTLLDSEIEASASAE